MTTKKKSSGGTARKFIVALVVILIIGIGFTGLNYYLKYFGANVTGSQEYLYIHTGADFKEVYKTIKEKGIVQDTATFYWAAENMNYVSRVKPGRYHLHEGMSNRKLINMLASGTQDPVELSFHNLRQKTDFARFIGKHLAADSTQIIRLLDSTNYVQQYGFTNDNVYVMFL